MSLIRPLFLLLLSAVVAAAAETSPAASVQLAALSKGADQELRGNILPFWLKYTRNAANGGFYGLIAEDMSIHPDAKRGSLLTCRILWTFSKAYETYHDPAYLEMATYAYHDLVDHFVDKQFGGIYWTITADGSPSDVHKQIYGQVFGIYALAEYFRATNEKPALDQAIAIYRLVEAHARDHTFGGYYDSLDRAWNRQVRTKGNVLGDAPKSQNSHIHILEGYTNLLRVWPDPQLRGDQKALITVTMQHLINPRTHHLILFLKDDWTPIGPPTEDAVPAAGNAHPLPGAGADEISYGHDIELSWLIVEAAGVVGDPALIRQAKPVALAIAEATLREGVDPDGGVINDGGPHGYTDTNKDWWPQAEAAVGFLNAYQLSGNPAYLKASRHSWEFIQKYMVDRVHGDWIEKVQRDGTPIPRPKVTLWKCPYHSGRSCFELMERTGELLAKP